MADGIRLDLQRALAEGPGAIPNMEPLFAPGAIPPVFDEAPEVQEGPGFAPEEGPITLPGTSVGQPVPPVKASRGERLRALLGNFLQNFGQGLQAASRAPSGAEFAAGFGSALSAGEERRQQKTREDLLRANQAFREQFARERAELDAERFEFTQQQAEAARIERDLDRAERQRERQEGRRTRGFRDVLEANRARRRRAGEREFRREERKGRETFQERLQRRQQQFQREQATTLEARRLTEPALEVKEALTQARLELSSFVNQDSLLPPSEQRFSGTFGIARFQGMINERAAALLGRKPTREETRQIADTKKVREFVSELSTARKNLGATEDDLFAALRDARQNGELNDTEIGLVSLQLGLISESQQTSIERLNEKLKSPVRRILKRGERIFSPAVEFLQGKRPLVGEPEPDR